MRCLVILLLVIYTCADALSQDVIYKKDNSKIECKVIEVRPLSIKYIPAGADGSTLEIAKSELILVQYANGDFEAMAAPVEQVAVADPVPEQLDLPSNIISFNFTDVVFTRFQVLYEKINKEGTIGYRIPLAVGFFEEEPSYFTGFDLNFYPLGQKKLGYYLGPKIRGGIIHDPIFYSDEFAALMFNNGVAINAGTIMSMSFNFAVGVAHSFVYDRTIPMATFSFLIGFRFY